MTYRILRYSFVGEYEVLIIGAVKNTPAKKNENLSRMRQAINIADIFSKYLFWNMDHIKTDVKKDEDIIFPRALYATNKDSFKEDIEKLEPLYNKRTIVRQLKSPKEFISNEVCRLVAERCHTDSFTRFSI